MHKYYTGCGQFIVVRGKICDSGICDIVLDFYFILFGKSKVCQGKRFPVKRNLVQFYYMPFLDEMYYTGGNSLINPQKIMELQYQYSFNKKVIKYFEWLEMSTAKIVHFA